MKWTVQNGDVSGALFFTVVPLTVEVLGTVYDKFVHPDTECGSLMDQ
jgi:hypothetical protein